MKLQLPDTLTEKEIGYIDRYFCEVMLGKQIAVSCENFARFLKKITDLRATSSDTLSQAEKNELANKLIEWIMADDAAFKQIIMANRLSIISVCQIPLPNLVHKIMPAVIGVLKSDDSIRMRLIVTVDDISILSDIDNTYRNSLMHALVHTKHLRNVIKDNTELCQAITQYPIYTRFFLVCMIQDDTLFDTLLTSESDWNKVKQAMQAVAYSSTEESKIRALLNAKLSKSSVATVWEKERSNTPTGGGLPAAGRLEVPQPLSPTRH